MGSAAWAAIDMKLCHSGAQRHRHDSEVELLHRCSWNICFLSLRNLPLTFHHLLFLPPPPRHPGDLRATTASVHPESGVQEQGRDVVHAPGSGDLPAGEGGGGAGETGQGEGGWRHGVHSKILLWDAVQLRGERTHLSPASQNLYTYSNFRYNTHTHTHTLFGL